MPRLGKGEKTILEEGMVVTVEPGVYVEGLGGIRIEDDVVVTATGCKDLTTARRTHNQRRRGNRGELISRKSSSCSRSWRSMAWRSSSMSATVCAFV